MTVGRRRPIALPLSLLDVIKDEKNYVEDAIVSFPKGPAFL